jgi:hypothetical protein
MNEPSSGPCDGKCGIIAIDNQQAPDGLKSWLGSLGVAPFGATG